MARIEFELHPEYQQALDKAARLAGLAPADYVRQQLESSLPKPFTQPRTKRRAGTGRHLLSGADINIQKLLDTPIDDVFTTDSVFDNYAIQ